MVTVYDHPVKRGNKIEYITKEVSGVSAAYMHFTFKENLDSILNMKSLDKDNAASWKAGSFGCTKTYGYNLDLLTRFKLMCSFPGAILDQHKDACCLIFDSNCKLWSHNPVECFSHEIIRIRDPMVLDVVEALDLIGLSIPEVKDQLSWRCLDAHFLKILS